MQHMLHNAMKIVRKDFASDKLQILWTLIFMIYMGFATSVVMNEQFEHLNEYVNPLVDFLLVLYAPLMGLTFNRRSFRYINEDSYTQMLYYYRSLPVPAYAIFISRIINAIIAYVINGIVFFGVAYAIANQMREAVDIASYAAFVISWIGIGFLLTGFYIYWENMGSGKAYLGKTLILMIVTVVAAGTLSLLGYSMFKFVMDSAMRWKLLSPVMWGSLIIGLGGMLLMSRLTYIRQQTRDLS
ncbi:hypothetical protein J2Z18_000706 [Paenibacillus lactis]|nr:hypothetical protein [Paenibacillus lactis]GIO88877.1 hypothetical protein J31TS3_01040 [Paenibacillus lactis]HAG00363.1 hypothetical protein [Paenibacillus lactis]